jgi:hypothetical protein
VLVLTRYPGWDQRPGFCRDRGDALGLRGVRLYLPRIARTTLGVSTPWRAGDLVFDDSSFEMHEIRRLAVALVEILATSRLEGTDPETQRALMEPIFAEYSRTARVTPGRGIDVTAIVGSGAVIAALLIDMLEDPDWAPDRPPSHPQIIAELRRRTREI